MTLITGSPVQELPFGVGFQPESGFSLGGSIVDGGSITINGSNFGTKPNGSGPMFYWEFGQGSVALGAGSRGTFSGNWTDNATITQSIVAPNRTHSNEMLLDAGATKNMNSSRIDLGSTKVDFYMFSRIYQDFDGQDLFADDSAYNLKHYRFQHTSPFNNINFPSVGQIDQVHGNPRISSENVGEGTHEYRSDNNDIRDAFGIRKNEWVVHEMEYHQGAVDVSEGTITTWANGFVHTHSPNGGATFVTRTAAAPDLMHEFSYIQDETNPGAQYNVRSDCLYMDDSFCRGVISEEATWNAATVGPEVFFEREIQITTAWADTQTGFTIRKGVFASLIGLYFYIIDSAGVSQKIGQFI